MNPRPPRPERGALPSCATSRPAGACSDHGLGSVAARRLPQQPLRQRGAGRLLLLVLCSAALSACGAASAPPPSSTAAAATTPSTLPSPAGPSTGASAGGGLVTSSTNQDGATSTCTAALFNDHPAPGSRDALTVTSALAHAIVLVTVHAPTGSSPVTTTTQTTTTGTNGRAHLNVSITHNDAGKFLVVAVDVGSSATCFTTLQVAP